MVGPCTDYNTMRPEIFSVFVLNVGRRGSTSFAKACSHITNFSSGHETKSWDDFFVTSKD